MLGVMRRGCSLTLRNFEGPLDLLLELIQNEKMDVTQISLSSITDQYLLYINAMQLFNIDIASEFFLIAATLVFMKTKKLLPWGKDENLDDLLDENELIEKLREYKKFKSLARSLWHLKEEGDIYYSRDYPLNCQVGVKAIRGSDYIDILTIGDLIHVLLRYKGAIIKKPIPIKRREVSVEEKMTRILNLLSIKKMVKFSELTRNDKSKIDKVASFLGSLELSFRQRVLLRQLELFADIEITKKEMELI
jgi:segregation and condensation protein A